MLFSDQSFSDDFFLEMGKLILLNAFIYKLQPTFNIGNFGFDGRRTLPIFFVIVGSCNLIFAVDKGNFAVILFSELPEQHILLFDFIHDQLIFWVENGGHFFQFGFFLWQFFFVFIRYLNLWLSYFWNIEYLLQNDEKHEKGSKIIDNLQVYQVFRKLRRARNR